MPSSYLYLNDLRVHYLQWNLESRGKPAILLHGLASNARIWEQVAPLLTAGGLKVIAPDARGHGLTDKPEGDYGFDTYFRDLSALINAFDLERPLLVGHSWGASIALDYAARVRQGRHAASGIVLVDGGMIQIDQIPGATRESARQRLTPPSLAGMPLEDFLERVQSSGSRWRPDDEAVATILANFEISAEETISPHLSFEHHMQIVDAMWDFPTYARFGSLTCPALLVPARYLPPQTEAEAEFLANKTAAVEHITNLFPLVTLHWMEDSIHDVPLQRPTELCRLILNFAASL
jgi:pimeloyl-ACP methyl ester carboxylesterase